MVVQRGVDDDSDDLVLCLRPLGDAPMSGPAPAVPADAEVRRVRRTARADRRARRRGIVSAPADEDGFSTDSDLEDAIVDDYTAAQHDLERRTHALLEDVRAEDFRDPQKGLAVRFADWRARYPDEYNGAFGGLALVQAWEFWARGEMVGWDPLRVSAPGARGRARGRAWATGVGGLAEDLADDPERHTDRVVRVVHRAVQLLAAARCRGCRRRRRRHGSRARGRPRRRPRDGHGHPGGRAPRPVRNPGRRIQPVLDRADAARSGPGRGHQRPDRPERKVSGEAGATSYTAAGAAHAAR